MWKYVALLLALLLVGCSEPLETYAPNDGATAQTVKNHVEKQQGVQKAHVYIVEKYLVVALDVSPWRRYNKTKIEDKVLKYLEENYSQYEIIASADRKLFFELGDMDFEKEKKPKEKLKQLQALLKEQT